MINILSKILKNFFKNILIKLFNNILFLLSNFFIELKFFEKIRTFEFRLNNS